MQTTAWRGTRRKFEWLFSCLSQFVGKYLSWRKTNVFWDANPSNLTVNFYLKKNARCKLKTLLLGCQTVSWYSSRRFEGTAFIPHRRNYTPTDRTPHPSRIEYSTSQQWEPQICQAAGSYGILLIQKLAARCHTTENVRNHSPKIYIILGNTKGRG